MEIPKIRIIPKKLLLKFIQMQNQCYNTGKLHKGMKVDVARSN